MGRKSRSRIKLAPVDMSCSFSVSDYRQFDMPLVYCSPTFEQVSGYSMNEIIGLNHRFMQAPVGLVEAGSVRDHTDNLAVLQMLSKLSLGQEVQVSLMNYKKGGRRWVNLLTMMAVPWDGDDIAYIVGFQVDIMESPESVLQKMPDSTYYIDYRISRIPRSPPAVALQAPTTFSYGAGSLPQMEGLVRARFSKDDAEGFADAWQDLMVEQSPNAIVVCSLKGVVSYCSDRIEALLGYTTSEFVNLGLQSICHVSDIVPFMRELREAEVGKPISLLARLRHRSSAYVWVEFDGAVLLEPNRGMKTIILSGRKVGLPALTKLQGQQDVDFGASGLWCRVDPQGMILWASAAVSTFLGISRDLIIGKNFVILISFEDVPLLKESLRAAFSGHQATVQHIYQPHQSKGHSRVSLTSRLFPSQPDPHVHPSIMICSHVDSPDPILRVPVDATADTMQECFYLEELMPERNTSWQYELHRVLLINRRLKRAVDNALHPEVRPTTSPRPSETICTNCFKRQTTQWRKGPDGPRSLCNSCGLRYAKQLNQRAQLMAEVPL
ncbi:hypothetical protein BCR37DRAFT_345730 [Protomyces lactucae-debilis]|uniref:Uncharacterized protein n=1 Tax=Protomyces lactucae-debilis TaxID=2754530 RepID=A0A1Y2FKP7_PROLT|nr:uncharacterized protein BCR37DRAFT_345730 [Protomyces lactucae-debilis]ORY84499.1 hypothetical protein BCR37DRAFT_345730 [Protomyces lactucae-debilis]